MTAPWTTKLDPQFTESYGVAELHTVAFEPDQWNADRTVISLGLPECELHVLAMASDDPVALVNRPPSANPNIRYWIRSACKLASEQMAFLSFTADTAEQASSVAERAAKLLPRHKRIALERLFDADGIEWRLLS